ncbi:MAG: amidohydrolase family protein, partial [Rhodococcus sp. (in: high G+C Gram-positive bacteria)]
MSVVWLTGATIIDGTGAEPIENCAVAVESGRISAIGGTPPEGVEVLDCTGLTITPGLIDAHVHLGGSSDLAPSLRRQISVAELAADMFATCASTLDGGFTTVRDCGGIDGGLAGVVASGKIPGPRIIQCGPIQCQTGGHGHLAAEWEPTSDWSDHDIPGLRCMSLLSDGPHEMRKNVRETFRRGADFLKLCVTGGVVSTHDKLYDTQFTVDEIGVAVEEANARGTYVTVHAHNNEGIRNAVTAGAKCVEHGSDIDDETAKLM